ncbi:MAG: hypothetical protein AB1938_29915 [Myxococcota bacterium]
MSSFGTVGLKRIWDMLEHCAPGFEKKKTTHNWRVTWNGNCFPSLPLGPHGKRDNAEIQVGHIKKMARTLGIYDCALAFLDL